MRKKHITFIILLLLTSLSIAEVSGKYAGEFIDGTVDARSLSLGGVTLLEPQVGTAGYFNPAILAYNKRNGILISHSRRFSGLLNQEFIGYETILDDNYLAFSIVRIGVDDIKLSNTLDENGKPLIDKVVSDNELSLFLSYGTHYKSQFYFGGSTKILTKNFEVESAYGIGFDIAAYYEYEKLKIACKLQDVVTSVLFWSTGKKEFIRPSLNVQTSYSHYLEYFFTNIKAFAGAKVRSENYRKNGGFGISSFDMSGSLGLELIFKDLVSLRGGIDEFVNWSLGSGIMFKNFRLDYGFKPDYESLGNTHKVSIGYSW